MAEDEQTLEQFLEEENQKRLRIYLYNEYCEAVQGGSTLDVILERQRKWLESEAK